MIPGFDAHGCKVVIAAYIRHLSMLVSVLEILNAEHAILESFIYVIVVVCPLLAM